LPRSANLLEDGLSNQTVGCNRKFETSLKKKIREILLDKAKWYSIPPYDTFSSPKSITAVNTDFIPVTINIGLYILLLLYRQLHQLGEVIFFQVAAGLR
jgi:hypothetical protein